MIIGGVMTEARLPKLPESVAEIAEVIGREKALAFIGQLPRAGSRPWRRVVYIPKTLPADHALVHMLGWHDAKRMTRAFSGMILQPANCGFLYRHYRNARIMEAVADGMAEPDIVDVFGISKRQVRDIIEKYSPSKGEATNGL